MMNLLSYKVIHSRPNSSRKCKMAAIKASFDHLIVPINAIYMNVVSFCMHISTNASTLSTAEQSNPLCDRNSAECHIPSHSYIALLSATILGQHPCHIARAAVYPILLSGQRYVDAYLNQALIPLPYLHLEVNTDVMVRGIADDVGGRFSG